MAKVIQIFFHGGFFALDSDGVIWLQGEPEGEWTRLAGPPLDKRTDDPDDDPDDDDYDVVEKTAVELAEE